MSSEVVTAEIEAIKARREAREQGPCNLADYNWRRHAWSDIGTLLDTVEAQRAQAARLQALHSNDTEALQREVERIAQVNMIVKQQNDDLATADAEKSRRIDELEAELDVANDALEVQAPRLRTAESELESLRSERDTPVNCQRCGAVVELFPKT